MEFLWLPGAVWSVVILPTPGRARINMIDQKRASAVFRHARCSGAFDPVH
jgi:hypothetical protein